MAAATLARELLGYEDDVLKERWIGIFCMLGDGIEGSKRCFSGRLLNTKTKRQLGLTGIEIIGFESGHTCCYSKDDPPVYFETTFIDYPTSKEHKEIAERLGGDFMTLRSKHLRFQAERAEIEEKADELIRKFFNPNLCGKDAIFSIGHCDLEDIDFDVPQPLELQLDDFHLHCSSCDDDHH